MGKKGLELKRRNKHSAIKKTLSYAESVQLVDKRRLELKNSDSLRNTLASTLNTYPSPGHK